MKETQEKSQKGREAVDTSSRSTGNDQRTRHHGLMARDQFLPSQGMENPWTLMQRFSEEIDRIFDNFGMGRSLLGLRSGHGQDFRQSMWSPQVEVYERDNNLVVCTDLPGMKKEDIHIELTDDMLMIRGERRSESNDTQEGYRRSERSYGSFSRSIPLPDGVDAEKAQASFEDGVLKVSLPLPPQQKPRSRRIEVQSTNTQASEKQKSASSPTQQSA
jgi:HSP20 family protein